MKKKESKSGDRQTCLGVKHLEMQCKDTLFTINDAPRLQLTPEFRYHLAFPCCKGVVEDMLAGFPYEPKEKGKVMDRRNLCRE